MGMTALAAARKDPALRAYLDEVRRIPRVDDDEAVRLAAAYRDEGDTDAGRRLVQHHLYLVIRVALHYHSQWTDLLDLIQEGNVGLMRAIDKFDPTRGVPFTAYARYWIRAMLLRYLMENYRVVKIGHTRAARKMFFELARERGRLLQQGLAATPENLAESWGLDPKDVAQTMAAFNNPEESLSPGPDGYALQLHSKGLGPEQTTMDAEVAAHITAALESFEPELRNERERVLWSERLLSDDPVSLAELGRRYSVSRERMRQLEAGLRKRLKQHLEAVLSSEVVAA